MSVNPRPGGSSNSPSTGSGFKALATVMALPLVDGVFPSLVLSGTLSTPAGVVETGVLVFGGVATASIILTRIDAPRGKAAVYVAGISVAIAVAAGFEAAAAPTIRSMMDVTTFRYFAAAILALIAVRIASDRAKNLTPHPVAILAIGVVFSLDTSGFQLILSPDLTLAVKAMASVMVGGVLSITLVLLKPQLNRSLNQRAVKTGGAVALIALALSVIGLTPSTTALIGPIGGGILGILR